jgi:hypothetical protein
MANYDGVERDVTANRVRRLLRELSSGELSSGELSRNILRPWELDLLRDIGDMAIEQTRGAGRAKKVRRQLHALSTRRPASE